MPYYTECAEEERIQRGHNFAPTCKYTAYYSHWSKKLCLLFQHNSLMLSNAYYSQNYASIMCQGLILPWRRVPRVTPDCTIYCLLSCSTKFWGTKYSQISLLLQNEEDFVTCMLPCVHMLHQVHNLLCGMFSELDPQKLCTLK